ncbi:hypothetical protein ACLMJK_000600 [Lecanora helva]
MTNPQMAAQTIATKQKTAHNKLYAKQQQRKIRQGLLPSPDLNISPQDYNSFVAHLKSSSRILALFGAGLSAASGIPTFRGPGGFWRNHNAMDLATPEAFANNPSLVWQFFNYRRHKSLQAKPNKAHVALAKLAEKKPGFFAITQNIDGRYGFIHPTEVPSLMQVVVGLSERAHHPEANIQRVHGSLFDIRCTSPQCTFSSTSDSTVPPSPALAIAEDYDVSSTDFPLKSIPKSELPCCPLCNSLLRSGVVWFGEPLPQAGIERIHDWLDIGKIDLMLVVGTSATVWPAANYIHAARIAGARVAVFDMEEPNSDYGVEALREQDWFFQGSAAETIPDLMKEVVGQVQLKDDR